MKMLRILFLNKRISFQTECDDILSDQVEFYPLKKIYFLKCVILHLFWKLEDKISLNKN